MDIRLMPDPCVGENTLHVSEDVDDELLAALKESNFDIVVEHGSVDGDIRVSPSLADRIFEWVTLRCAAGRDV